MISVAAELAGMHPQTLRIYEQRGLIEPNRSPEGHAAATRRRTSSGCAGSRSSPRELGMNLAGVERVFELEGELEQMRRRMDRLERRAEQMRKEFEAEVERVRRSFRRELVPYEPPEQALDAARRGRRPHHGAAAGRL